MIRTLPALFLVLLLQAADARQDSAKPHNPEQMYLDARTTLDDENTETISGVLPLLEESATQGHPKAVLLLLDVYEGRRKGLDAQPAKAAGLARMVAKRELKLDERYPEAAETRRECMFRYALFCERGTGCPRNEEKAFEWMYQTAAENVDKARVELARYLMMGIGARRAPRDAMRLLLAQAKARPDTPNLFFYLGYIYQKGLATHKPDPASAFKCYTYGARYHDARAINNLAGMYEQGIGASRNLATALNLYKKAAALGNKEASANMQRLAYRKAEEEERTPASNKISNGALRVLQAMPLSPSARARFSAPFLPEEREKTP